MAHACVPRRRPPPALCRFGHRADVGAIAGFRLRERISAVRAALALSRGPLERVAGGARRTLGPWSARSCARSRRGERRLGGRSRWSRRALALGAAPRVGSRWALDRVLAREDAALALDS